MEYFTTDKILTLKHSGSKYKFSQEFTTEISPLLQKNSAAYTVAVCMDSFYDSYEIEILNGIKKYAKTYGLRLIYFTGGAINSPHYDESKKNAVFNLISRINVDSIILLSSSLGSYCSKREMEYFCRHFEKIPMVSIGIRLDGIPSITVDNYGGMYKLLVHLLEVHNCRRMAFIRGPEKNEEAQERFRAYKDVLTSYNIPWDENWVYPGTFSGCSAKEAVAELIQHWGLYFDAIVAANDLMAVQAVQELNLRGIDVPEDVIVTGFDNVSNENCSAYFLTTVNQSAFQMGFTAAESLFGLSIGRTCKDLIKLPTELILRSSCGCIQSQKEKDDPDHFPKQCKTEAAGTMSRKSLLSKNNERGFVFSVLCKALGTVKNIEGLKRALLDAFPKLHIKSCYISLFESNKYSRNIFFYKDYNMRKLKETDESFQTYDLVPGGTGKLGRGNAFIMMTLSGMNDALGFVLYESKNSQNELFEVLTLHLSSSLQRLVDDDVLVTTCKKVNPDYQLRSCQKYKYLKCGLPEGKAKWFYKKLLKTMDSQDLYKNPDLTLPDLAGKLHISRNHLSHVINVSAGVNFFDFINRYRINEAKRILSDPEAENFNILNIAFEAGFKSKSTFNKVFKKFTAKTPKEFRRDKK